MRAAGKRMGGALSRHGGGGGGRLRRLHLEDAGLGARSPLAGVGGERGQSTVEYLLVLVAFVSVIGALGLLWHAGRDGVLVGLATQSASHGVDQGGVSLLKDVLGY